jgi:hypothetical protein
VTKSGGPYRIPLLLCLSTLAGLALSLLAEGVLDALGLGLLALPLVASGWKALRSGSQEVARSGR